jgi:hypothetical protein
MGMLPCGLKLQIALKEAILTLSARVGDLVTAQLESPARVSPGVLIPRGVVRKGRIRQFEKMDDPPNTFRIGLAFSELESAERFGWHQF